MTDTLLPCVEVEPREEATAAVVWLHGLGADGHDFKPIVPLLNAPPNVRFVFPHAPSIAVTINGGFVMPAWYDILEMGLGRRVDEAGLLRSAGQVEALLARERERGVPPERIVLAGFSQGGAVALYLGLRYPERLAGLMGLSTYLVCDGELEEERSPANTDVPVLQAHGTVDPMVPCDLGRAARERLTGLGYAVEWHDYPMGHEVCPQEIEVVGGWLRRVLG